MKYPYILLFRYKKYSSQIDNFILENQDKFNCSFFITHKKSDLNKFFDPNYNLLVTFGDKENDIAKGTTDDPINEYANDIYSIFGGLNKKLKNLNSVDKDVILLPLHLGLKNNDVEKIINLVQKFDKY